MQNALRAFCAKLAMLAMARSAMRFAGAHKMRAKKMTKMAKNAQETWELHLAPLGAPVTGMGWLSSPLGEFSF